MRREFTEFARNYCDQRIEKWNLGSFNTTNQFSEQQQRTWKATVATCTQYWDLDSLVDLLGSFGVSVDEVLAQSMIPKEFHSAIRELKPFRRESVLKVCTRARACLIFFFQRKR
jgi:hypothetical protein